MGLSSALATAMSGLRANQAALSIISSNVANAQTPGYVVQNPNQIEISSGTYGSTVQTTGVNRQLDLFVQSQLRTETAGGAYADQIANILGQLQSVYGTPGGDGTLETSLSNFTSALQALSNNPGNQSAQSVALQAAQSLAQQLNTTTQGIQSLRSNVNQDIGNTADQANTAMNQIAQINTQLQGLSPTDPLAATLMDQRDNAINQLAKLVDIKVVTDSSNQTNIFINSGLQLVGAGLASEFKFSSPGSLTATSLYNANPAQNGVGSLNLRMPNGARDERDQLGADRRRPQAARPDASAGADPGRSDGGDAGLVAVGPDDGRDGGRRAALGLRRQRLECAARQHDQPDLHRHRDQYPAADQHRQCHGARRLAAAERRQCQSDVCRRQFLARHDIRRVAIEHGAGRKPSAVLQSVAAEHDIARDR